ncbi:MAG: AMP-binding protein [Longimicrobiales bacterium]
MTPLDLLAVARERGADPDAPFVVTRDAALSLADLDWLVGRRAERLAADGVAPGTVHPLTVAADLGGLLSLLALWRLGVTPAPLNARLAAPERERAVRSLAGAEGGAQAVLWTSGTSGSPRGVVLSAENLQASAAAAAARLGLGPADRWLASLSPAHVGGLALITRPFFLGGSLVLPDGTDPATLSRSIHSAGLPPGTGGPVTHMSLVHTQLLRLLDHRAGAPPPSSFRCVLLGGAHTPATLLARALAEGWPVALTYGMTEMTSQVCTAPPDMVRAHPGTVGPPLDGVELRLADDGEILVRGPTRAVGYLGGGPDLADADGWYHTGDLGELDPVGRLRVTGRRSDRILSGGVTVDPREVEDVLQAHPDVCDACVVGLPDPAWGDVVAALVVPFAGTFDLDALDAWVRERLGGPRRPRRWLLADAVPVNANGKKDRAAVRARFAAEGGN